MSEILAEVKNLSIDFRTDEGVVHAVKNISYSIPKGKTVALVGESGSGKSVSALTMMGLLPRPPGRIVGGEIFFEGKDLLKMDSEEARALRGHRMSMIFQEPMTSLNPVFTIGDQICEPLMLHEGLSKKEAMKRALELLERVRMPNAAERLNFYPHQMSGGQRQRAMIAMAIACRPSLLIADEPTTALDVTIQKQILDLLADLQRDLGMSMLFITHDLGVVADIADEVLVMYRGDLVESGPTKQLFDNPQHPYTKALLACRPALDRNPKRLAVLSDFLDEAGVAKPPPPPREERPPKTAEESSPVLLSVENLRTSFVAKTGFFGQPQAWTHAVAGVDLKIRKGRTLGLVGESGCGKTTLGRTILRLIEPTEGKIIYNGTDLTTLSKSEMTAMRRKLQIIFQDPYASLNPRMTVNGILSEPMEIHNLGSSRSERSDMCADLLKKVGLNADWGRRYPHEMSGGQRQRVSIARALAVRPEFIICDESVSALDVSVQAQILNLLLDLQEDMGLTYLFISHDLAVVKYVSDEVAVMNGGKIVERNTAQALYENPQHDYTKTLLNAIPKGLPKTTAL